MQSKKISIYGKYQSGVFLETETNRETNLISTFMKKLTRDIELYSIEKSPQTSMRLFQKHPMFKLRYLRKKVKANRSKLKNLEPKKTPKKICFKLLKLNTKAKPCFAKTSENTTNDRFYRVK